MIFQAKKQQTYLGTEEILPDKNGEKQIDGTSCIYDMLWVADIIFYLKILHVTELVKRELANKGHGWLQLISRTVIEIQLGLQ